MSPILECPYCGLNLFDLPNHDLYACKTQAAVRRESQVKALERLARLSDDRKEEKK